MIPFNYNFTTKEVTNFVDKIKFMYISWKAIPAEYKDVAEIAVVDNKLYMVIPIKYIVDVTVVKYTITNTGKEFVALRGKIQGITNFPENFDNSEIREGVLFLNGPRF